MIPRRVVEVLADAEVALGGDDGGVAERELDLLERGAFPLCAQLLRERVNVFGREV